MINLAAKLEIERLGQRGEGIARGAHGHIYVRSALAGETVLAEVDGEHGHLIEILESSPQRIAPSCEYFPDCGGCAVQTLAPDPYAAWKQALAESALRHAGLDFKPSPIIAAHGLGRRRATFHIRFDERGRPSLGFMQARQHKVVEIQSCPLLAPSLALALPVARALADVLRGAPKPLDTLFTGTLTGLDADLRGYGFLPPKQRQALIETAIAYDLARLSNHGETLIQTRPPLLEIGKAKIKLPPGTFLQATEAGENTLAEHILKVTSQLKIIADLFAGIGTFALHMAETTNVHAFDLDATALSALRAASHAPHLKAVKVTARDLFRHPLLAEELLTYDAVIFDPPRAGAEAQARALAKSNVPLVVAISCNAQTFSRDAAILRDGGYLIEEIILIDQFLYSPHVEIFAVFKRAAEKSKRIKRIKRILG